MSESGPLLQNAVDHLEQALAAEGADEIEYHVRQALQLLRME
ncbi:hypothetical protein [Haloarcula nitratireducens]|nr:hypothetical protein [Halomicroarcula nitratireducens]